MKSSDIVTILAGGILAFVAFKVLGGASPGAAISSMFPTKINANTGGAGNPAAGWQYFTNGTAIAPNGDYYYQGALVWKANQ